MPHLSHPSSFSSSAKDSSSAGLLVFFASYQYKLLDLNSLCDWNSARTEKLFDYKYFMTLVAIYSRLGNYKIIK
jgi:hypothetical protein